MRSLLYKESLNGQGGSILVGAIRQIPVSFASLGAVYVFRDESDIGLTMVCPQNINVAAAGPPSCPSSGQAQSAVVTFPAPAFSEGSPNFLSCTPPSGSVFPVGTTGVRCEAADALGHTAQTRVLMFISQGGERGRYFLCCGGQVMVGNGRVKQNSSCKITLTDDSPSRNVSVKVKRSFKATASFVLPVGFGSCSIKDSDVRDNTCACP